MGRLYEEGLETTVERRQQGTKNKQGLVENLPWPALVSQKKIECWGTEDQ